MLKLMGKKIFTLKKIVYLNLCLCMLHCPAATGMLNGDEALPSIIFAGS